MLSQTLWFAFIGCEHWQGYGEMPLFRSMYKYFSQSNKKFKVPFVYYMVI